ncbi:hypothetical protein SAMN04489743_2842 [Pseudarthrobacter equi]|uniref:Uncharacterized protein n=1 Tax=Pseudarthrobacter equi TaxID=728066 RepID=A0A1H2A873_9MICC|nr:hypothetical protein [Pseudarthrobacter equi]SDT42175.1 hypothetical protein SAMN04489743_2842 [Pseudarthrobacter equi]
MRTYATAADLVMWLDGGKNPDNAKALLRSASLLVEKATKRAVYRTNSEGFPLDAAVRVAFRDATTAQVEFWAALGVNPVAGTAGTPLDVLGKGMDGASVAYGADKSVLAAKATAAETLGPVALNILSAARLLSGPVRGYR